MKIKFMSNFFVKSIKNIKFLYPKLINKNKEKIINFIYIDKKINTIEEEKYYRNYSKYKSFTNCSSIKIESIIKNNNLLFDLLKEKNNVLIGYYKSISWIYRMIKEKKYNISILKLNVSPISGQKL